ncbi:MAG: alpha/beta hydrolase family protein [Spirochaetota bacterium]
MNSLPKTQHPPRTSLLLHGAAAFLAALVFATGCAQTSTSVGDSPGGAAPSATQEEDSMGDVVGDWRGAIRVNGQELPLVFHISRTDGELTATMDSPAQAAAGIPVDRVRYADGSLELRMTALGATYVGTPNDAGTEIAGTFRQSGMELELNLTRSGEAERRTRADASSPAAAPRRPQEPEPPFPYVSQNVTFVNEDAGVELAGTVTRPDGDGPFPAAVLISGSGRQNRNEEIMGHKPFLVLADALTRAGVAVLRYDDRGVGGSGGAGTVAEATARDFAGDAAYALRFLSGRPYVDPGRAGLVGHSEGALIAAMIAGEVHETPAGTDPLPIEVDPAFVVMLGGEGVPGDELLMMQSAALLRASGASEEYTDRIARANRKVYDILLSDTPRDEAAEQVAQIQRELGMNDEQIAVQRSALFSPWFDFFLRYDPAHALQRIEVPVLAVIGELDRQVPPEGNLPEIRSALESAPTDDYTVRELAGLNHLLQPAETGGIEEYSRIETTIAPEALELVTGWIGERFTR